MIHGGTRKEVDHGRIARARAPRGHRALRPPFEEEPHRRVVADSAAFRRVIDARFRNAPELFPAGFSRGYQFKDDRVSAKRGPPIRRVLLRDGVAYNVQPSFLVPYMAAHARDVEPGNAPRTAGVDG